MSIDQDKLKRSFLLGNIATSLLLAVIVAGLCYGLFVTFADSLPALVSAGIVAASAFILSLLTGSLLLSRLFLSFNYVVQALLHIGKENSTVAPPDPNKLNKRNKFLHELTASIYDLRNHNSEVCNPMSGGNMSNLAQLSVPAIAIKADNSVAYANPAASAYFGFNAQEALGKQLGDVTNMSYPSSSSTLESWLDSTRLKSIKDSYSWDRVRHHLADGGLRQFDMVANYSKDNPNGYETLLVIMDHTARYTQEDNDVGFVALAVHELRTPLTAMRGYIEVFEDELAGVLNPEQATFMNNMSAQAQQLADFVNNILNVARVEENQLHLQLREEDWGEILRKTIAELELRARVRGMKIKYTIPEDLPLSAADKVTMYEVIVNLVDNAIKYTHSDGDIVINTYLKDKDWIETTITDKGIGIPGNVMGHLFQKFYRSHRSNRSAIGTGLGLYLSKAIVNAHGGQIWVKSVEGEGSTFGFTIPTYESVAEELKGTDNKEITREAHGWIKNHSLYRG